MKLFITRDEYKLQNLSNTKNIKNIKKVLRQFIKPKSIKIKSIKNKNVPNIQNTSTTCSNTSNKKALLIAVNYENTKYQLNGCTNDIMLIKSILDKRGFNSFIITEKSPIKPTKDNIIKELSNFLRQSKDGDTLYIHYSGHGSNVIDSNGDENDKKDETIVTTDLLNITDEELKIKC